MAHKGDTQADSEAMPKLPNSYQRNGIYYYKRRYPKDLRDAGLIEEEFDTGSLDTRDPKQARSQVDRRNALFSFKVERLRAELGGRDLNRRSKSKREFSAVSVAEQKDLILRWFVEQEQAKCTTREQFQAKDEEEKEIILEIAQTDLADYRGSTGLRPFDWEHATQKFFQEWGISCCAEKIADTVVQLFRRAKTENQWRTVAAYEGNESTWDDELFRKLSAFSEVPGAEGVGHTIAEICERFPTRKQEGKLSKATLVSYALPLRIIEQFWGSNTPLRSLDFEDGEALIQFLSEIPTNADRKYKGLTLKEAAKMERAKDVPKTISPKRQKDLFLTIKAALNHAVEIGWIDRNPLSSRALLDRLPRVEKRDREQFSSNDLQRIFTNPRFTEVRGKHKDSVPAEGRFWVPLLGLFHGLRANEAASLMHCDVKKENGVAYLWIRETDDDGNHVKGLKTESSRRKIPIHSELVEIGFLDFVKRQKEKSPDGFLFPEMIPNEQTGNRAKVFSQWFGRLVIDSLGEDVAEFGKDFHSFRHAVTDCLRAATESDEKRYALLGWVEGAGKRNAGFNYGAGFKMTELKRLIDNVRFPELDLNHLYKTKK